MNNEIVIVAAKRTPIGSFQGVFNNTTAVELSTVVTKSIIDQISIDPNEIDEVIIGCVLTAGLGQAPARQVSIASGLSLDTGAITVNKVCSSGLQSILIGNYMIKAGTANIVLAGGMESKFASIESEMTRDHCPDQLALPPVGLNDKLASLTQVVASAHSIPTSQSFQVFSEISLKADNLISKLENVVALELPAFNKLVSGIGLRYKE